MEALFPEQDSKLSSWILIMAQGFSILFILMLLYGFTLYHITSEWNNYVRYV